MDSTTGIFFWGFLIVYGIVMFLLSPKGNVQFFAHFDSRIASR